MKIPFVFVLAWSLASAASAQPTSSHERIVSEPSPGATRTVSAGSTIHEKSRYFILEEAVTTVDEVMKGGQWLIPLTITPDDPLTRVSTSTKFKACSENGPCGLDDDGDGVFDRMAKDDSSIALKLKKPVRYSTRSVTRVVNDPKSFKQFVLYTGATHDTLRLSYRELANDMARAAFTEELTLPLSKTFPQEIAVKDLRFRIHRIVGLGMSYEILP